MKGFRLLPSIVCVLRERERQRQRERDRDRERERQRVWTSLSCKPHRVISTQANTVLGLSPYMFNTLVMPQTILKSNQQAQSKQGHNSGSLTAGLTDYTPSESFTHKHERLKSGSVLTSSTTLYCYIKLARIE